MDNEIESFIAVGNALPTIMEDKQRSQRMKIVIEVTGFGVIKNSSSRYEGIIWANSWRNLI